MKKILTIISLSTLLFTACSKDKDAIDAPAAAGKTTLTIDAAFGTQDFALNKDFTANGKTYNFKKFRYWLSNLVFINAKGEEVKVPGSYYLMEETGALDLTGIVTGGPTIYPATKREDVQLSGLVAGDYKSVRFSIGVDKKYNDNLSLQAGELSQLNGMTNISWMWMTSYIFSSIEGSVSDGAATKNIKVETGLNDNFKTVTLNLPQTFTVDATGNNHLTLTADISKVLDGVDVIATPIVGAAQKTAMETVAANYATKVFSVKSLK